MGGRWASRYGLVLRLYHVLSAYMGVRLSGVCLLPMAGKLPSYFREFVSRELQSFSTAFDAGTNLFPLSLQQQKLVPVTIEDRAKVPEITTKASIVSNLMGPYAMQLPMRMALGSPGVLAHRTQELPGKYSVKRKDKDPTLDVHKALVHHFMGKEAIPKPSDHVFLRLKVLTFDIDFDRPTRYQIIEDILLYYTKDGNMQNDFTLYMKKCHDMLILLRMANELLHDASSDQGALSMCFIDSDTFTPIVGDIRRLMKNGAR